MQLRDIPAYSLMLAVLSLAMLAPCLMALAEGDERVSRAFLYASLATATFAAIVGFALATRGYGGNARRELFVLLLCWLTVPLFAAIPLVMVTPAIGIRSAIFEMIAAFTTTGGTIYGDLSALPDALNLWRGLVGWLGGLLTLTAAYVVLAPRRLGGFEIAAATWRFSAQNSVATVNLGATTSPLDQRIRRAVRVILPVYGGLTALLALCLSAAGQSGIESLVHAMSVMSTSGITPNDDGLSTSPNLGAEMLIAVFLVLAISRRIYSDAAEFGRRMQLSLDPEIWTMAALVAVVSLSLFARHWVGALTIEGLGDEIDGVSAAWGTVFTVLSFLTTTGFVSGFWEAARDWSGWANPGLILLALAAIGGGAATTAGGIKLIRTYALMRHGLRELERISQPHSVIGIGAHTRGLLRDGPAIVWTFVMLFIFTILISVLGLTALRLAFVTALVAAIAAVSNTGPALEFVSDAGLTFRDLTAGQRDVLAATMIVGRFEVLALVALANPDVWTSSRAFR